MVLYYFEYNTIGSLDFGRSSPEGLLLPYCVVIKLLTFFVLAETNFVVKEEPRIIVLVRALQETVNKFLGTFAKQV